jgi:hypothetical protein
MHFFLYEGKHWRKDPKDDNKAVILPTFAKWIRTNVSSYSMSTHIGYDRHGVGTLDIIIPILDQAMLFKLTWL